MTVGDLRKIIKYVPDGVKITIGAYTTLEDSELVDIRYCPLDKEDEEDNKELDEEDRITSSLHISYKTPWE